MQARFLATFVVALMMVCSGSAASQEDTAWPEPRALGKGFASYRSPQEPLATAETSIEVKEPTGVLTLRQALSLALMNNPELAAFSWEVRAQEARKLQAGLLPNPEFEFEMENFGGTGVFGGLDEAETTFGLGQLVELGGKRAKRKRLAALERDLAGWDYETRRIDVFAETTQAFVDVLAAQERVSLNGELVSLAEKMLNTVSARVRTGKVSPVDQTKAEVALSTSRIALERSARELETARSALSATWGNSSPVFERVVGELSVLSTIPSLEQVEGRISNNPDIARWMIEMESRRASVDVEKAGRIPDPTVTGGVRLLNESDDTAFVVGLSIPLPVFDRNQGSLLEARYRLSKAEAERRAVITRVRALLAERYQALSATYVEATSLRDEVLPGAQRVFEAAGEAFRQGKLGYLEVLDAQRTFFEAKTGYVDALNRFHQAIVDVERLIGEPIGEPDPAT
jgi:cobalt-zinc-cadmium efflux system outer membrane protein